MATAPTSLGQLCDAYEAFAKGYYRKPNSRRLTGEHIQIAYAIKPLREVPLPWEMEEKAGCENLVDMHPSLMRAEHLDLCREWMIEQKLSRKVINARCQRIRRMFRWAATPPQRWVDAMVIADLGLLPPLTPGRTEAPETQDVEPVAWELVTSTLAVVELEIATMIEVGWHTGMRPGEICAMQQSRIQQADPAWIYKPTEHKNQHRNQDRTIYIGPEAQAVLRPWLARIGSQDKIFKYNVKRFWEKIYRANKYNKIEQWHPNQLRHSCGVRLARARNLDAARVVLGHSRIATTEIYAKHMHTDQVQASQIMQQLG